MASQKLFDQAFFNRLTQFTLSPRIRPSSGLSGHYKSGKKGTSIEFSDIREYLPGDDIRRIDWNAYARTEKLFVKLFMDEREAHYHILLDMSRSMDIPQEKSVKARRIAGMLAWLALNSGDRVDITFLQEGTSYTTKSRTGTASFYPLLKELEQAEFSGCCDLASAIRPLSFHGSGTTFIISDFLRPWEQAESPAKNRIRNKRGLPVLYKNLIFSKQTANSSSLEDVSLLEEGSSSNKETKHMLSLLRNRKQSVVLIQVTSREEENPELLFTEDIGENLFTLIDSETGEQMKITPKKTVIKTYLSAKASMEKQLASTAARCQALYLKTVSDEPLEKFLEHGLRKGLWK